MVFIQRDVPSSADLKPFNVEQVATEKTSETELLQMSAACTMKGVSLQIAKLSALAADVFLSLLKEAKESKKNIINLTTRVKRVGKLVPVIDDYLQEIPRDQLFKRKGVELSIEMNEKEQLFSAATRTAQLSELIESTLPPPHLELLDYDSHESESCLLKYSNPLFFFNVWLKKMTEQEEAEQKLRKERREKNRARRKEKRRPIKPIIAMPTQSVSPFQRPEKESVDVFELVLSTRERLSSHAPSQKAPLSEEFAFTEKDYVPNVPVPPKRSLDYNIDIAPRQRCAEDKPRVPLLSLSENEYQEYNQATSNAKLEEELARYKENDRKNRDELAKLRKELEKERAKRKSDEPFVPKAKINESDDEIAQEEKKEKEKVPDQPKETKEEAENTQDLSATIPVAPPPPPAPLAPVASSVPIAPPAPTALLVAPQKSVAQPTTTIKDNLPPQTAGRKDLLAAIASSSTALLHHVEPQKKVDPHASLLDSIRGGIVLKKVEKVEKKPQAMPTSVAAILARRIAIQESDSEESDSEEWSD